MHCRLGDLSKKNGHFKEASADYSKTLALRREVFGNYHQKVADCYMSLATMDMNLAIDEEGTEAAQAEMQDGEQVGVVWSGNAGPKSKTARAPPP